MKTASTISDNLTAIICGILVLFGLYLTSLYSYLLFHSLTEIFSIVIACGIFLVAWNSRRFLDNSYLLFLGVAYLFIGGIDLFHTLAYKGMGIFKGYGSNLPTQLWIVARYVESISLLIAPLLINRKVKIAPLIATYFLGTFFLLGTIFVEGIFPDCFIEGKGLTSFKKISEYIISFILIGALLYLIQKGKELNVRVFKLLIASIITTIAAELAFTFYISVYGLSNLIGHFFKIISFYLIYTAIIETGFIKPYDLLFRTLKMSEEKLQDERDSLQKALAEVKKLSGLLPICASCKKVRDDKGYWNQIESYIRDRSEVDFSHSICPECAEKLYPDL